VRRLKFQQDSELWTMDHQSSMSGSSTAEVDRGMARWSWSLGDFQSVLTGPGSYYEFI